MSMTDKEKTNELLNLMDALCSTDFSKNISSIDAWISELCDIYADHYRHSYSDIFFKLQQIITKAEQSEVLEILGENLNVLEDRINKISSEAESVDSFQDVLAGCKKLSDHIKLEISRYNFIRI